MTGDIGTEIITPKLEEKRTLCAPIEVQIIRDALIIDKQFMHELNQIPSFKGEVETKLSVTSSFWKEGALEPIRILPFPKLTPLQSQQTPPAFVPPIQPIQTHFSLKLDEELLSAKPKATVKPLNAQEF